MDAMSLLIAEIEGYCALRGISETTFGRRVVNDGKFVGRLRSGRQTTIATAERVRQYIEEDRPVAAE